MKGLRSLYLTIVCLTVASAAYAGGHSTATPSGEKVFEANCANCHTGGFGGFFTGAPKVGKKSAWEGLLPKGVDGLTATTIAGIGEMAERGGCTTCTDAEIRAAVEYMVEKSK